MLNSTIAQRFWDKVSKTEECWLWTGGRTAPGKYGLFTENKHRVTAHSFSWRLHHGPIPEGLEVCHTCDNPPCVNPNHLFLGTRLQNMQDCVSKDRQAKGPRVLPAEAVEDIRSNYSPGKVTMRHFSRKYGVSVQLVCLIVHRKTVKY
jgi:hypothetical protein